MVPGGAGAGGSLHLAVLVPDEVEDAAIQHHGDHAAHDDRGRSRGLQQRGGQDADVGAQGPQCTVQVVAEHDNRRKQ